MKITTEKVVEVLQEKYNLKYKRFVENIKNKNNKSKEQQRIINELSTISYLIDIFTDEEKFEWVYNSIIKEK